MFLKKADYQKNALSLKTLGLPHSVLLMEEAWFAS
jgi:hypothetical protein